MDSAKATVCVNLTIKQASDLTFLLTVNANRDLTREHNAYQQLSENAKYDDDTRAKFASNAQFCADMLAQAKDIERAVFEARLG